MNNRSSISVLQAIKWLIWAVFSVLYLMVTWQLSSSVPYLDDYDALLSFLISIESESSGIKKMEYLFAQFNEHRIVIPRLIVWGQYIITGELNLRITILIGNIFLISIAYLLNRHFFEKTLWGIPIASVLLLMNYIHFENYQWALSGLQNYGMILLVLCSFIYCKKKNYYIMFIFSVLAALCGGVGVLLFLIYVVYFLMRKEYKLSIVYCACFIAFYLVFYYIGDSSLHHHPGLIYTLLHLNKFLGYYFILIVSYTSPFFRNNSNYAIALGITVFVLNVITMKRILVKDRWSILFYFSLFLNILLPTIAYGRYSYGFDQAFASRYVGFSTLYVLVTLGMFFQGIILSKTLQWTFSILLVSFAIYHSYVAGHLYKPYVIGVRQHLHNTICVYKKGEKSDLPYIGKKDPNEILKRGEELGIINISDIKCD